MDGDLPSGTVGFDYNHYAVGLTYEYSILTFDASWTDASDDCGAGDMGGDVILGLQQLVIS